LVCAHPLKSQQGRGPPLLLPDPPAPTSSPPSLACGEVVCQRRASKSTSTRGPRCGSPTLHPCTSPHPLETQQGRAAPLLLPDPPAPTSCPPSLACGEVVCQRRASKSTITRGPGCGSPLLHPRTSPHPRQSQQGQALPLMLPNPAAPTSSPPPLSCGEVVCQRRASQSTITRGPGCGSPLLHPRASPYPPQSL
jgi:hypothetical protein